MDIVYNSSPSYGVFIVIPLQDDPHPRAADQDIPLADQQRPGAGDQDIPLEDQQRPGAGDFNSAHDNAAYNNNEPSDVIQAGVAPQAPSHPSAANGTPPAQDNANNNENLRVCMRSIPIFLF